MRFPYDYQRLKDPEGHDEFRVRDVSSDSRVATCYLEENARLVASALNECLGLGQDPIRDGSLVVMPTGETRPPKAGEWYQAQHGCVMRAHVDFEPGHDRVIVNRYVMRMGKLVEQRDPGAAA